MAALNRWERYSLGSLEQGTAEDPKGRIFATPKELKDLSRVRLCGSSVDTVRQLYHGQLKADPLEAIQKAIDDQSFEIRYPAFGTFRVAKLGKGAGAGYRYKLQNNEEGLVILLAHFYSKEDRPGTHLKIELSPHFISQRGVQEIQSRLDQFAALFLTDSRPAGVAVHLALDVQHWRVPLDFEARFVTHARVQRRYDGVADWELEDLATVAITYGKKDIETLMYGKANSLQTVVYDKTKEIKLTDKVDYFHDFWNAYTFGDFEPDKPVWRIEMRFHHSIVQEIGHGLGETLHSFQALAPHLTDLWRYAMTRNRLMMSKTYLDPYWQLFTEDAEFLHPANGLWLRRKKKQDVSAVGKNLSLIVGNLITLAARKHQTVREVMKNLKRLDCFDDLLSYYRSRSLTEADLREQIEKGLALRRLIGKAA